MYARTNTKHLVKNKILFPSPLNSRTRLFQYLNQLRILFLNIFAAGVHKMFQLQMKKFVLAGNRHIITLGLHVIMLDAAFREDVDTGRFCAGKSNAVQIFYNDKGFCEIPWKELFKLVTCF